METGWTRKNLTLPVRVGARSLFEFNLDAAVSSRHFSQISSSESLSFPSATLDSLGVGVAVIHSCPVESELPRVTSMEGGIRYVPCHYPRYYTNTEGEFDTYFSDRFNSKSRSTLRRKVKKLAKHLGAEDGEIDLRSYSSAAEVREWYPIARSVSELTYQEKLLKRGLPEESEFLDEIVEKAEKGRFRGYLLFDGSKDKAIAFLACPISEGGAMIYDHVGHDPEYDKLSPGAVLLYKVLQDAFGDPSVRVFDFTEGEGDHKKRFATHESQCADVFFFKKNAGNAAKIGAHALVDGSLRSVSDLLERFDLKDRIKKIVAR